MIEWLESIDRDLLLFLNGLRASWMDGPMWVVSQIYGTAPWFLLMYAYMIRKKGWAYALTTLIGAIIIVTLADRISVELFKDVFQRYRPTHNLEIRDLINTVTDFNGHEYRGGLYGFLSSHAANFFGLATFYWLVMKPFAKLAFWPIFAWASIVTYSRVYLGVHYPSDVFFGSLLGVLIGLLGFWIFTKISTFLLKNVGKDKTHV